MEIKTRSGQVIATGENLKELAQTNKYILSVADLRGADLRGADLSGAYLSVAYLSGAYLRGANLSGADLRGANLSHADLRDANLSHADLRDANLSHADLRDANLSGARLNWQSHTLLGHILRVSAGPDIEKRKIAGFVLVSTDLCWKDSLAIKDPLKNWALETLAAYVKDGDNAPAVLKRLAKTLKKEPTENEPSLQSPPQC